MTWYKFNFLGIILIELRVILSQPPSGTRRSLLQCSAQSHIRIPTIPCTPFVLTARREIRESLRPADINIIIATSLFSKITLYSLSKVR